ncbi:MAG TPA: hypothetical protein PKA95_11725 [Thermomicrobiales bacterium]|nr:hypothetical protein [Thermomicrobiales bacterium]
MRAPGAATTEAGGTPARHAGDLATHALRTLERIPAWLALALTGLAWLALTAAVLRRDFLEYNADGYTRIIRGHEWLAAPRWELDVWLPLQTWLFGAALAIHDSLRVTPRVVDALLTLVLLANLYLIGRMLGGRLAGLVAAGLGAVFPWVVWMGISGMAEPLFHATLSTGVLGLALWLREPRQRWLALAAAGLLLATMARYEGWFYAGVFAGLVVLVAWQRGLLTPRVAALAGAPLLFPLVWIVTWWRRTGDPLAFARETAEIKEALEVGNAGAGLLRRLTIYPEETFRLAPLLIGLCLLAAGYTLARRARWWPLPALVLGQAAALVVVSAGFSNLGPGAERYLISNVILLFPVLGAVVVALPVPWPRLAALALVAVAGLVVARTTADPPTWYPDADARQAGVVLREALAGSPDEHDLIPVLLPPEPSEGFNAGYALRVLSDHPDNWFITSNAELFAALASTTHPPVWVADTSTGAPLPPAERTATAGRFVVGWPAPAATVALTPATVAPGDPITAPRRTMARRSARVSKRPPTTPATRPSP